MKTFGVTGDLGDVIFCLPAIRELGGGEVYFYNHKGTREPMTAKRTALVKKLLEYQSYIDKAEFVETDPTCDYDFADFRESYKLGKSLAEMQADWVGVKPDFSKPWLKVPKQKPQDIVVINRSVRYRNGRWHWSEIMNKVGKKCVFVGLPSEHQDFEQHFGPVTYQPTKDFYEVAKLISSAKGFIGNQSCCNAIAEGLKVYKYLERNPGNCDCLFR